MSASAVTFPSSLKKGPQPAFLAKDSTISRAVVKVATTTNFSVGCNLLSCETNISRILETEFVKIG